MRLEELETQIETLQEEVNDPSFFSKSVEQTQPVLDKLSFCLKQELEVAEAGKARGTTTGKLK